MMTFSKLEKTVKHRTRNIFLQTERNAPRFNVATATNNNAASGVEAATNTADKSGLPDPSIEALTKSIRTIVCQLPLENCVQAKLLFEFLFQLSSASANDVSSQGKCT